MKNVRWQLRGIFLAIGLAFCLMAGDASAQTWPFPGGLDARNGIGGGGFSVIPSAQVGYQGYAFSFNLPAGAQGLDLGLMHAGLPMGSIGLLVTYAGRFGLFAEAEGTPLRTVSLRTTQAPFQGVGTMDWTGSKFQQGSMEAGLVYTLSNAQLGGVSLVGAVRWSKISMTLDGPSVASTGGGSFDLPLGLATISYGTSGTTSYDGDLNVPIWIPYFGVRWTGENYKATLIGSPFASVQANIPLRSHGNLSGGISATGDIPPVHPWPVPWVAWVLNLQQSENDQDQISYKFNRLGGFLEGDFEYDLRLTSLLSLNLWARGQWFQFRGQGTAGWRSSIAGNTTFSTTGDAWAWRLRPPFNSYLAANLWNTSASNAFGSTTEGSSSGTGSFSIYSYTLGMTASLSF